MKKPLLVITVEGGTVQSVSSDNPMAVAAAGIDVIVVDYDGTSVAVAQPNGQTSWADVGRPQLDWLEVDADELRRAADA